MSCISHEEDAAFAMLSCEAMMYVGATRPSQLFHFDSWADSLIYQALVQVDIGSLGRLVDRGNDAPDVVWLWNEQYEALACEEKLNSVFLEIAIRT